MLGPCAHLFLRTSAPSQKRDLAPAELLLYISFVEVRAQSGVVRNLRDVSSDGSIYPKRELHSTSSSLCDYPILVSRTKDTAMRRVCSVLLKDFYQGVVLGIVHSCAESEVLFKIFLRQLGRAKDTHDTCRNRGEQASYCCNINLLERRDIEFGLRDGIGCESVAICCTSGNR